LATREDAAESGAKKEMEMAHVQSVDHAPVVEGGINLLKGVQLFSLRLHRFLAGRDRQKTRPVHVGLFACLVEQDTMAPLKRNAALIG